MERPYSLLAVEGGRETLLSHRSAPVPRTRPAADFFNIQISRIHWISLLKKQKEIMKEYFSY